MRCNYNKKDTISIDCLTSIRNGRTYYFCFGNEAKVCVSHPTNLDLSCCTTDFEDPLKDLEDHISKLPTSKPLPIPSITTSIKPTIDDKNTNRNCFDSIKKCHLYSNLCYKNFYNEIMKRTCKKTCNLC